MAVLFAWIRGVLTRLSGTGKKAAMIQKAVPVPKRRFFMRQIA
jgi:hypothetical protein